ncbi:hypothetical protein ACFLXI_05205 [Chloroflexota bacterium]
MQDNKTRTPQEPNAERKLYDQQPGEPNMWYERFFKFCLYGPSRTIRQCYRDVMEEQEALSRLAAPKSRASLDAQEASKKQAKPKRRYPPTTWKNRAKQFKWWERAAAWDAYRREESLKHIDEAFFLAREFAPEAILFLVNLIRGKLVLENEDGEKVTIYLGEKNIQQMRLASNSILNRAGVVYDGPAAEEEDGEVKIIGIKIERYED